MRKKTEILEFFADRSQLDRYSSFYLVGIGGAGMSGLAKMLKNRGFHVAGSDSTPSVVTSELIAEGMAVRIGHAAEGVTAQDAVILSDAIDLTTSPEVVLARQVGAAMFRRSQLLGWLLQGKKVIAVTGTHGKTTTTGMLGAGLQAAGADPVIVVGASVPQFEGPIVEGKGEWAVVEACEAYDGFQDLDPTMVVLTNLEPDHLDYHGTWQNLQDSVERFVDRLPPQGKLIYCASDLGASQIAKRTSRQSISYTIADFPSIRALRQRGEHNSANAAGAYICLKELGLATQQAVDAIVDFSGAERRQQILRSDDELIVIDDYAHHPTEVKESIRAIKSGFAAGRRLIVVFQPHLYSRTAEHLEGFAEALNEADFVVLTDIYPAREAPMPGISSARIAEKVDRPVRYVPSRHLLPMTVAQIIEPGDVVVGMGAGNVSEFPPALLAELGRSRPRKVAVLYGGDSAEREVSLHSGLAVHAALLEKGYQSELIDVTELLLKNGDLSKFVGPGRPDLAFLAVHGTHAEDGALQGLLELLHIPYTGSGLQSSALAMDKDLTKKLLESQGLRVPKGKKLENPSAKVDLVPPLVVKPNAQGSTVGLSFVRLPEDLAPAIRKAFQYDSSVIIEELIEGMEISVPVLGDRALPPVEIVPDTGEYDFASKYLPGATQEICPARLPEGQLLEAQEVALRSHRALGCEGATRTDMIVSGNDIFVLEVNTLPGLTGTSLLPNSAKAAGITFEDLVEWITEEALNRHAKTKTPN